MYVYIYIYINWGRERLPYATGDARASYLGERSTATAATAQLLPHHTAVDVLPAAALIASDVGPHGLCVNAAMGAQVFCCLKRHKSFTFAIPFSW